MGPFYAYARSALDTYEYFYRYLIVFASHEVADEWWRIISRPASPAFGIFDRISPQYYTYKQPYDMDNYLSGLAFTDDDKKTFKKMFFTLITKGNAAAATQSTFPQQDITDHVSGKWYYIRSKAVPNRFWYCNISNGACLACGGSSCKVAHVSTELRLRFFILAPDIPGQGRLEQKDLIMVGKDKIKIAPNKEQILVITDRNQLKVAQSSIVPNFAFSDLRDKFAVSAEKPDNGSVIEYIAVANNGSGEVWELAD